MNLNQEAFLLQKMIKLIEAQKTGDPSQLSAMLRISRSKLYEQLEEIKSTGVEIGYDRKKKSFKYTGNKRLFVREPVLIISDEELNSTNGGYCRKLLPYFFLDGTTLS